MIESINEIFPMTIVYDRYGGAYSGGVYTAWNKDFWDIPEEVDGCDPECSLFWLQCEEIVGVGNTPNLAAEDLMYKLNEYLQK